jgi:6-phosphogluconolactonase
VSPAPDRVLEVLPDADAVARRAAGVVAAASRAAIESRGRFTFAVSGGETPWAMFKALAEEDVSWDEVGIWQVDERVAPDGDPDRNLTSLLPVIPAGADLRPMPVTEPDLEAAADRYAALLPDAFELVHLGMGDDGHTASLVPGDPVLDVTDRDVAVTGEYRGLRRMTVTYPVLDRAGLALWMITGSDKAPMVPRLLAGDRSIPAGRVATAGQLVLVDAAAAADVVAPS